MKSVTNRLLGLGVIGMMINGTRKIEEMPFHCHLLRDEIGWTKDRSSWESILETEVREENYFPKEIKLKVEFNRNKNEILFLPNVKELTWYKVNIEARYLAVCFEDKVFCLMDFGKKVKSYDYGNFTVEFETALCKISTGD